MKPEKTSELTRALRRMALLTVGLGAAGMLSGCVMVGYSSRGGWFVWPGSIGLLILLFLLFTFLRRR